MRVQKKRAKKPLIITLIVVVLLAAGAGAYIWFSRDDSGQNTEQTTQNQENRDEAAAEDPDSEVNRTGHEPEKDIPEAYEGENPNTSQSLTGIISHKSVTGGQLVLRTTISQTLGSGSCQLRLTKDGQTVTRESNIAANPSSATCEGFDVPTSELSGGTWSIEITMRSGDRTGTIRDTVTL